MMGSAVPSPMYSRDFDQLTPFWSKAECSVSAADKGVFWLQRARGKREKLQSITVPARRSATNGRSVTVDFGELTVNEARG